MNITTAALCSPAIHLSCQGGKAYLKPSVPATKHAEAAGVVAAAAAPAASAPAAAPVVAAEASQHGPPPTAAPLPAPAAVITTTLSRSPLFNVSPLYQTCPV